MFYGITSSIIIRLTGAILLSLLLSLWMGKACIKRFKKMGMVDYFRTDSPSTHRSKKGIPTGGGIFIIASLTLGLLVFANLSNKLLVLAFLVTLCSGLIGLWDDRIKILKKGSRGLKVSHKLIAQTLIALCIAGYLYLEPQFDTRMEIPFIKVNLNIGWGYIPLIAAVFVGTTNAVNLTDGLDGLCAGCLVFAGSAYGILAYFAGDAILSHQLNIAYIPGGRELAVFWAAVLGGTLGFLWYNTYPAQIFMGDTGTQVLGGALGVTAVLIKKEILLVIIGGIFVIEALSIFIQITSFKLRGKRILKMSPLHHHYELKGIKEPKIVVRFWIAAFFLALAGLSSLVW
ncbi:MAG: phospho-N-acetylmuramoyl-pentapeptide-transferase [Candidatus Aerophobetes bacterium]|nr:phospho-N-acetylmuramoyl-pentapeptide-transferase [Candidatus Aerophobetes bacterium]